MIVIQIDSIILSRKFIFFDLFTEVLDLCVNVFKLRSFLKAMRIIFEL